MYCYVHPLLKTAAYCAEDRKLGLRNTPVVTFYRRKRNLSRRECNGVCIQDARYRGVSGVGIRGTSERPQEGHELAMGLGVALDLGVAIIPMSALPRTDSHEHGS